MRKLRRDLLITGGWLGKSEELEEEAALKDCWRTGRIDIAKRKGSRESILQKCTILYHAEIQDLIKISAFHRP